MEINERIELLAAINRLFGIMEIFSDIVKEDCDLRDNNYLEIFRENSFDIMYEQIEEIKNIVTKPFPNYEGYNLE